MPPANVFVEEQSVFFVGGRGSRDLTLENLVTNGTFTGNADNWNLDAAWVYSSNAVIATADGTTDYLTQTGTSLVLGTMYRLKYTISASDMDGDGLFFPSTSAFGWQDLNHTNGTHIAYFRKTNASPAQDIRFALHSSSTPGKVLTIDNISVVEWVGHPTPGGCTKAWWDAQVAGSDEATVMAKLMTSTGAPIINMGAADYTTADEKITKANVHFGVEAGMVVYVIKDGGVGTVVTGRYTVTDVGVGWIECLGIQGTDCTVTVVVGGAFDELNNAADETDATIHSVWIHTNLDETLSAAVTITAGGSNTRNTFKYISGFNTIPGDMNFGGAYYEAPFDILLAGSIGSSKTVTLDANNGAFVVIDVDADNLMIENLYLTNTNAQNAILFSNTPQNIVFRNCRFSDVLSFCNTGVANYVLIDSCYGHSDTGNHHYLLRGSSNVVLNCVSNVPATKYFIVGLNEGLQVTGCLAINGAQGVRVSAVGVAAALITGNTFYDQTSYGVNLESAMMVGVFNNIFALSPGAVGLRIISAGTIINDYNCFIHSDGTALTVGVHASGYEAPVIGPHGIEVDPLFVDPAGKNFRLQSGSPCRRTGKPTIGAT